MLYMQDMDPGPAKILHKPEKGDTLIENAVAACEKASGKTQEN